MSSIKMIDQTEKSVSDLECAINKLLDENYLALISPFLFNFIKI